MRDAYAEIKKQIRRLKKAEQTIRPGANRWVWNDFFNTSKEDAAVKYPLTALATMSREAYRQMADEYFAAVYYWLYKETGYTAQPLYDPDAGGEKELFILLKERYNRLVKH